MDRRTAVYEDALRTIIDIAIDYDGCRESAVDLRDLVDELRSVASDALHGKSPTYIKNDKVYNCFNEEVGIIDWKTYKITYHNQERNDIDGD